MKYSLVFFLIKTKCMFILTGQKSMGNTFPIA